MITKVTQENLSKYTKLFSEAAAELNAVNKWDENDANKGKIDSLKQYFHYIADLAPINTKYTVLPADEDVFDIDANTREITVPSSFRKNGVGVQNDHIAEVLYFRIDRYFDSQDLGLCKIYIQWQNASGELGLTREYSRDLNSEEGKLIFGWPISESITQTAGPVQFAIRFYTAANEDDLDTLSYSFGTKTQSVVINPTLAFDLDSVTKEDLKTDIVSRLTNSGLDGSVIADTPAIFISYHLTADGEVDAGTVLGVIGYSPDPNDKKGLNDNISYKWYYSSDPAVDKVGSVVPSGETYLKIVDVQPSAQFNAILDYYKNSGTEELPNYTVAEVDANTYAIEKNDLYLKFSTYTIPNDRPDILGQYYVVVNNTVPYASNNPAATNSAKVFVVGPDTAAIIKDLENSVKMVKNQTVNLSVDVDTSGKGDYSYKWEFKELGTSEWVVCEEKTNPLPIDYDSSKEGTYKVTAIRSKNNNSKKATSKECIVYIPAKAPTADGTLRYTVGQTCDLVVTTGEEHPGTVTYKWKYQAESGGTSVTLSQTNLDIVFDKAGIYTLEMRNTKIDEANPAYNQTTIYVE